MGIISNAFAWYIPLERGLPWKAKLIGGTSISCVVLSLVFLLTYKTALVPMDGVVGFIVEKKSQRVVAVVYPCKSRLSEEQNFMKAPNLLRDTAEWFRTTDRTLSYDFDFDSRKVKVTTKLFVTPKIKAGDILPSPVPTEEVFSATLESGLKDILTECLKGGGFDDHRCKRLVEERLSNSVFRVEVENKGFQISEIHVAG